MYTNKNNIFDFATSELSQDAFICWCLNWFNDDSKPKLKELSIELIREFTGIEKVESIRVERQVEKIDILVVINEKIALIIEDKIDTSEHGNQIERYKELIRNPKIKEKYKILDDIEIKNDKDIKTVYFKTGFIYDNDKCVMADKKITGSEFLKILVKYVGESEILDSYVSCLTRKIKSYEDNGMYENLHGDDFWKWNIAKSSIAQYKLMRDIFSADLWVDKKCSLYKVRSGSNNNGRPWTQLNIIENKSAGYGVFWRIDTDSKGPYLSLRLYDVYDKKYGNSQERHKKLYDEMRKICEKVIDLPSKYKLSNVIPGYKGKNYEAELIHINLINVLKDWENNQQDFIENVKKITNEFVKKWEEHI